MKEKITQLLQPHVDSGAIAGVVALVASRDRTLETVALGKADISSGRPMRDDTMFWIASTSKPITATLLMMFVDEGKIALDDPLEKYIPAFIGNMQIVGSDGAYQMLRPATKAVTIRQAMSHTSGLTFFSPPEKTIDIYPLDQAAMSYALSPLLFDPGSKYQYGNVGINSVGRVLEIVSGRPFDELLHQRVIDPLKMTGTTFILTESQLARMATNYHINESKTDLLPIPTNLLRYPLTAPDRTACPGGGLFSTASDVARFGQMILNGGVFEGRRYLSDAALRTMTSTQTGSLNMHSGPRSGYGLGFETFAMDTEHVEGSVLPGRCGHGGALSNHLDIDPHTDRVTVFMVQQQGWKTPEAEEMRKQLDLLNGLAHDEVDGR